MRLVHGSVGFWFLLLCRSLPGLTKIDAVSSFSNKNIRSEVFMSLVLHASSILTASNEVDIATVSFQLSVEGNLTKEKCRK